MEKKKITYFDFITYHEDAKLRVMRRENASEELIAAVDEEVQKELLRKKSRG